MSLWLAAWLALTGASRAAAADPYPESVSRPPVVDEDPQPGAQPRRCHDRPEGYSVCADIDKTLIDGFFFTNTGVNRIVTRPFDPWQMSPQRWWQFDYHLDSRQDLSLWLSDMPSSQVSEFLESYLMFFPRRLLPSIRAEKGLLVVTLPTGETFSLDASSKVVVAGALSETGPLEPRIFPRLSYGGPGVMLRADAFGADPRVGTIANITRGQDICSVPAAELWTPPEPIMFRFATDAAFDAFLRARCGFGLSDASP